ncbi:diaminopimelate epimerase [Thiomonas bhubaneswarensis]|uniref:Diaminopimelate epimerase n=1 Tax=Thiomonas bhubaneswarensis TaxID=339866 RepID=A0A0K6I4B1_9BURK|nr:diaminopimelate epimerase [Thiomonas bhubaneswarensis]CUA98107.1 diaminopimelate epimerase [Thiomonas bhubaneswarensis]
MQLAFTKMHGAGNDFVVLDATRAPIALSAAQLRLLADRHFGVGADQILMVEPPPSSEVDFRYRIFNADGGEVEQCGNGARCFVAYVHGKGLTDKRRIRVQTLSGIIEPELQADGRVTVDMGAPVFNLPQVPFDASGLSPRQVDAWEQWPLDIDGATAWISVLSMGNPHAVQRVDDVDAAPVHSDGPRIEHHPRFPKRVNAGFMQIVDAHHIRLRVWERGAGETLACGTGACAAVVAGLRHGWLRDSVDVETRGGLLTIAWAGPGQPVHMTGPAAFVFDGLIALPDLP